VLDLSSNNLTGTVDLSFMKNIKDLLYISLSYNKLSIVEEDGNHSYAEYPGISELKLASCNLSCVPKFLMQQRCIYYLDLSNNNIGGRIPDWIWGTAATDDFEPNPTTTLNLSHNLFTSVATDLSNTSFVYLDLHSNMIKGAPTTPTTKFFLIGQRGGIPHLNFH
jgi:Leucine-rich repeat (LRR) protein